MNLGLGCVIVCLSLIWVGCGFVVLVGVMGCFGVCFGVVCALCVGFGYLGGFFFLVFYMCYYIVVVVGWEFGWVVWFVGCCVCVGCVCCLCFVLALFGGFLFWLLRVDAVLFGW